MLFTNQLVYTGSENTKDPIHKLWKRAARNSSLSVSLSQLDSAYADLDALDPEAPGCPPDVFGPLFPGKDGSIIMWIRKSILLGVEREGVGPPSLLADDRLESPK